MQTFDAAFQSRIHISLEYPELDAKSRKTVWQNFLAQHDVAQQNARDRPPKALASAAKAAYGANADSVTKLSGAETAKQARELHQSRTHPHKITPSDLEKLCDLNMNGR